MHWFSARAFDLTKRTLTAVWASFFNLHCSSLISCMNAYLVIDSGGHWYKQASHINCSMAGCFPEKLRWCLIEQVCQGSKV